jgi:hypothetical protein
MTSNRKAPFSYEILETADGSPTLSLFGGEKMHSMEGALAESEYIYRPCIEKSLMLPTPRILSMGLGLGYNEIISSALLFNYEKESFTIHSFEIHPELRDFFRSWCLGQTSPLKECYNWILTHVAALYDLQAPELKTFISQALEKEQLILDGPLPEHNPTPEGFHSLLYDAFSGETDKDLWTQDYLLQLIDEFADPELCVLSTYAATGNLKRALIEKGFAVEKKKGFGKKRESTFASRSSMS